MQLLWKMLTTCANLLKDLHECLKFVLHYIRYRSLSYVWLNIFHNFFFYLYHKITFHIMILQYIRKLLFSDLDKSSIEHVLRQLRKLPWSDCESYLLKCFMKVHKGKYGQIHLIASLTAGLSRYHDEFAVAVVDEVCFCY